MKGKVDISAGFRLLVRRKADGRTSAPRQGSPPAVSVLRHVQTAEGESEPSRL